MLGFHYEPPDDLESNAQNFIFNYLNEEEGF